MTEQFQKFSDPGRSKPKSAEVDPPVEPKGKISPVLVSVLACVVLAAALSSWLCYHTYQTQVVAQRDAQLAELSQQRASLTAQNIHLYMARVREAIAQFADKPLLKTALEANDETQLQRFVAGFQGQLDGALKVRVFPRGTARLDNDIYPPIRFSELELIGLAERQEVALPEAARINNEWLITMVAPVVQDNTRLVYGTVMVSLRAAVLAPLLAQNNTGLGQVTLQQVFDTGAPTTLISVAGAPVAPAVVVPVKDSHWQVVFAAGPALVAQTGTNGLWQLAGVALGCIFLIALSAWFGRQLGTRIAAAREDKAKGTWKTIQAVASAGKDVAFTDPIFQRRDILDVEIANEDEALLALDEKAQKPEQTIKDEPLDDSANETEQSSIAISETIFRAYDIRGIYGRDITKDVAYLVGQALGSEAMDVGDDTLIVARDARLHSPQLTEFLIRGILSTGCHVLNIGTVPTPLLYFATETLADSGSGVMVTASHNPADHNGFKVVMGGKCRSEEDIKAIRSRILSKNIYTGSGEERRKDIVPDYINTIFSDVALAGDISIVIDAANAVPGVIAPRLFEELGCHVTPLNCELDGSFPNHSPDPSIEENLQPLIAKVQEVGADLGIALDGDGDRLVVVTPQGKILWPDRLLMLFAKDIVARNPGADVVFDVKSTRHLANVITSSGGRPIIWKTGHSPMKLKMAESGALLGGEYSGHIFIKDRWYGFDDGLYAAARLIEIVSLQGQTLDEVFADFPESPSTPEIRVSVPEENKFALVEQLIERGEFGDGKKTTLDGLRIDYSNGWGLVRASNTSAHLTMRFEADDEASLHTLKALFVRQLREIDSTLKIDWDQTN
ncbi:phosphomannomutase/phosphoglucomutase [Teredinibacter turnerae]|uniref:phosphomannomutase/phosphoglucomutase n=1 Tax=Teredinibacter turnerae TaxID=2426 RepID=UPI0003616B12|nr:phosphomannomutase/phosphoglucomutase [Teredinibacter turnerae]